MEPILDFKQHLGLQWQLMTELLVVMILNGCDTFKCSVILDYSFPLERTITFSLIGNELIFENENERKDVDDFIRLKTLWKTCLTLKRNETRHCHGIVVVRNED